MIQQSGDYPKFCKTANNVSSFFYWFWRRGLHLLFFM